jgi:hypothetical protein
VFPSARWVRAWAKSQGITVPERGKLRPEIWDAWQVWTVTGLPTRPRFTVMIFPMEMATARGIYGYARRWLSWTVVAVAGAPAQWSTAPAAAAIGWSPAISSSSSSALSTS